MMALSSFSGLFQNYPGTSCSITANKPRGGLQQRITVQEPLIRRIAAPSPRIRGEGKKEGSYLEGADIRMAIPLFTL